MAAFTYRPINIQFGYRNLLKVRRITAKIAEAEICRHMHCWSQLQMQDKTEYNTSIGVIYGEYKGYRYPHFLDWGVQYPSLFWTKRWRICCQQAVNRSDLQKINYSKTIFGLDSAPDPAGRADDALPDHRVGWGGDISSPFSSAFASGPKGASFSFWIGTPLFRPKLRPWIQVTIRNVFTQRVC